MAPLLINSRDLLKLGSIVLLIIALVFAAGFFMGHQRATAFYQAGSELQSLSLPEKTRVMENVADSQPPSIIEAGEDIDVDRPEAMVQTSQPVNKSIADSNVIKITAWQQAKQDKANTAAKKQLSEPSTIKAVTNKNNNGRMMKKAVSSTDAMIATSFTSDELNKIKYSIQVGMYGRLINAENMVKMLNTQHYDAYVSDYTNKKNKIRYNVRVGYFSDKKSAISMLNKFKADQRGDGYLVKFSADNIVNIAGAVELKQITEDADAFDRTSAPSDVSVDVVREISQADFLSDKLITAN